MIDAGSGSVAYRSQTRRRRSAGRGLSLRGYLGSDRTRRLTLPRLNACATGAITFAIGFGRRSHGRSFDRGSLALYGMDGVRAAVDSAPARTYSESSRASSALFSAPWCSGQTCHPVTVEIAGSNPVGVASTHTIARPAKCGAGDCSYNSGLERHLRLALNAACQPCT